MQRKITKQSNSKENAYAAVVNLIDNLNLNVSNSAMLQVQLHADYPSLSSISDNLTDWRIENLALNSSIYFCIACHSFYYKKPFSLNIQITTGMNEIKGGGNYFHVLFESPDVLDSRKLSLHS